jgi:GT2 family glycosyltransferase
LEAFVLGEIKNIGISIIVSMWNRDKFLVDALQSVVDQDYKGKTQVVLCDGQAENIKISNYDQQSPAKMQWPIYKLFV